MKLRLLVAAVLVLLAGFIMLRVMQHGGDKDPQQEVAAGAEFELPQLSDADYDWIAAGIFRNEAAGKIDNLTYWGAGEDFPSLGIGHFIWFPAGVDAPFDEQFPDMVAFVSRLAPPQLQMPEWLQQLQPFDAPWTSKTGFDEAWSSPEMAELRTWLAATQAYQVRFIVAAFEQRWRDLELPGGQKPQLTALLQELVKTPEGLFALIDYYNFKGLGNNPRERYQDEGWGLVQVLTALAQASLDADPCMPIVDQFRDAAAARLRLRVELSPPERNETRWLAGWLQRLDDYTEAAKKDPLSACGFRVTPWLQNPDRNAMTLIWLSNSERAGQLVIWEQDEDDSATGVLLESRPILAKTLGYHPAERCTTPACSLPGLPFLHQLRITGLKPGTGYRYRVTQDFEKAGGTFSTLPDTDEPLRFIVYGDSETEPESTGKHAFWQGAKRSTNARRYPLDQTTGYAQNLKVIQERRPGFVAIAGDLVQSGGEQRDWDEFWLHNAPLAASTVLVPAPGNHDYFGGPGELGKYDTADSERAVRKFQTYFDLPANGASDAAQEERYYALHQGVVTLIVLDTNDAQPHQGDMDTNWRLRGAGDGGFAPDWQPGSEQYAWLENELQQAQLTGRFTFVMFHGSPYTSGVHGRPPGELPGRDILSAAPLQSLTPLFMRYGVDAVFGGHDEMYEHSVVAGTEVSPEGQESPQEIHFYDVGIGGDGLRGPVEDVANPYRVFLAHSDAPETYTADGVLADGGKHYGHLEVNIERNPQGIWQARLDAVYIFPVLAVDGSLVGYERRLYADSVTLTAH
jgi:hypothetical protein